jgi:hypothetical protein
MLGGLASELRAGGYQIGEASSSNGIEDEEDDTTEKVVNKVEVKKYAKLLLDSLSDICRIAAPVLTK